MTKIETIFMELQTDPENKGYAAIGPNYVQLAQTLNTGYYPMIPNPEPQGTIVSPIIPTVSDLMGDLTAAEIKVLANKTILDVIVAANVDANAALAIILWLYNRDIELNASVFQVVKWILENGSTNTTTLLTKLFTSVFQAGFISGATGTALQATITATETIPDPNWEETILDVANVIESPAIRLGINSVTPREVQKTFQVFGNPWS